MPNPGLTDDQIEEAAKAYTAAGGNRRAAADLLGMNVSTYANRLRAAAKRGLIGTKVVLPGYAISKSTDVIGPTGEVERQFIQQRPEHGDANPVPDGHSIRGMSSLVTGDGRTIQQWIKTRVDEPDPAEVAKKVREAFDGMEIRLPEIPKPEHADTDILTFYPLADWHLGMMAWGKETVENWDLSIAQKAMKSTMADIFAATPNSQTGIVLGCGDFIHSDNKDNRTYKSGNALDVDQRYQKIMHAACDLAADMVLMALQKHECVIVRFLPGNHDEHSAVGISQFLRGVFQSESRVTVDTDPSLYFSHSFGKTLLVATHGDRMKPQKLRDFVTARYRKEWGEAEKVYAFVGHFHHKERIASEEGGMITEMLPAPIPPDAYHYGAGYISGRSMTAITYHRDHGEVSRDTRTIRLEDAA